jgi:hypothetical protein
MEYNISPRSIDYDLKKRYQQADIDAQQIAQRLRLIPKGDLRVSEIYDGIKEIVRIKYFLDADDMITDHFNGLGEISIAKALGVDRSAVVGIDLEAKCNGTSSVMTKKILLIICINRELNIEIDPHTAAEITTISQLATAIFISLLESFETFESSKI